MMGLLDHTSILAADRLSAVDVPTTPRRTKRVILFAALSLLAATAYVFFEEGSILFRPDDHRDIKIVALVDWKKEERVYQNIVRGDGGGGGRRKKRRVEDDDVGRSFNVLTLGGSVTYGHGLEQREIESYPNLLRHLSGHRVTNVAVRAADPFYPSLCIQSILEKEGVPDDEMFDVIVFEFSHGDLRQMDTLVKRLQYRYPNAVLIYVHLYSLRAVTETKTTNGNGEKGELRWLPEKDALTRGPGPFVTDLLDRVGGHLVVLPRSVVHDGRDDDPYRAVPLFQSDGVHLSARGHRVVADALAAALGADVRFGVPPPVAAAHRDLDGTWGHGDRCVSWFRAGDEFDASSTVLRYTGSDAALVRVDGVGDGAWAVRFDLEREAGTVTIRNDRSVDVPLFLSFLVPPSPSEGGGPVAPRARVGLPDGSSFLLRTTSGRKTSARRNGYEVETADVGTIPPGDSVVTFSPIDRASAVAPLYLVGVELFGFRHHDESGRLPLKMMHNRITYRQALDVVV